MFNMVRKFLFRCNDCKTILSIEFENEDDIDKVQNDKVDLECVCGGHCEVLRD